MFSLFRIVILSEPSEPKDLRLPFVSFKRHVPHPFRAFVEWVG